MIFHSWLPWLSSQSFLMCHKCSCPILLISICYKMCSRLSTFFNFLASSITTGCSSSSTTAPAATSRPPGLVSTDALHLSLTLVVNLLWAWPAMHRVVPPQPLRLCRCQCPEHLWYQFLTICPWSQSLHPSKDHTIFYYFGSAPTLIIIFLLWTCSDSYSFTLQSFRTQTSAPNFKVFGISPSVGGQGVGGGHIWWRIVDGQSILWGGWLGVGLARRLWGEEAEFRVPGTISPCPPTPPSPTPEPCT